MSLEGADGRGSRGSRLSGHRGTGQLMDSDPRMLPEALGPEVLIYSRSPSYEDIKCYFESLSDSQHNT